jgi:hypothetical protein
MYYVVAKETAGKKQYLCGKHGPRWIYIGIEEANFFTDKAYAQTLADANEGKVYEIHLVEVK